MQGRRLLMQDGGDERLLDNLEVSLLDEPIPGAARYLGERLRK